jgi:hypothetical protein
MSSIPIRVFLRNPEDADRLNVIVTVENVEYQPATKTTVANLKMSLMLPNTDYLYAYILKQTGDAVAYVTSKHNISKGEKVTDLISSIQSRANGELSQIKKEIKSVMEGGVETVSLDLLEALKRIAASSIEKRAS